MDLSANNAAITAGRNVFSHNTVHVGGIPFKERVIKWSLCSTKYRTIHNDVYSSRNLDTGTRFFESSEYKDWVDGKEKDKRNLECVGKPGAGKTSTASAIIEDLLTSLRCYSEPWVVLYAYFRHDFQSCQTIPIVFTNFLGQIVDKQPEPSQPIRELYDKYAPHDTIPRLDQVIPILKSEISESKRSYIVVDALDEFSLEDPSSRLELVAKLEDLGARLLITSRCPVDFTPDTFSRITVFASNDDLVIYVRGQLASNIRLKKLLKGSPELEQEIIEKICEKCDGMFIIARLLVESISRMLKISQVRDVLKELPKGLDATYELAMDRIDSQSEEFRKLGRNVIEWVVFAKERLNVAQLLHAVSYEPGMETISENDLVQEDDMISACAGLIVISGGYVQLVHFSTQEFFARFADRYFPDAQRIITETCLRYLALSASTIPPEIEERLINGEEPYERQDILQEYRTTFPLATHAATHWGSHAFDIRETFDHSLAAKFYQFPVSPYIADDYHVKVEPTSKMNPLHYQILYCARFGLAVPSLLGLQVLPSAGNVSDGVARAYVNLDAPRDYLGKRPLHLAVGYGHNTVLNLLIEANADVNVRNDGGRTPLSLAAEEGRSDIVGLLLDGGADPNIVDNDGWTPLAYAAWNGDSEAARILLDDGADPNIADNDGRTPLALAAQNRRSEAVRMLLDGGADPNINDKNGRTPLAHAAQDWHSEAVRMLLDGGADPNIADNDGRTPLAHAAQNGHSKAVRMLLDGGADSNIADKDGRTPLAFAAWIGHSEALRVLLSSGADPNIADNCRWTPLFYVAGNGDSEAVRMLLDGRADPNISLSSYCQWTPLFCAVDCKHPKIVKMLLDSGANPDIVGYEGKTPLAIAEEKCCTDIVRMLEDRVGGPSSQATKTDDQK